MDDYEIPPDNLFDRVPHSFPMDCDKHFVPNNGLAYDMHCEECGQAEEGDAPGSGNPGQWR